MFITNKQSLVKITHPSSVHVTCSENPNPGPHNKGNASLAFLTTPPVGALTLTGKGAFPNSQCSHSWHNPDCWKYIP